MDNDIEKMKKAREIADAFTDYNKLSYLISINDEIGMQDLMQRIGQKYIVEKIIYNAGAVTYPDTIRENAMNCCKFLKGILLSKGVDATKLWVEK